MQNKLTDLNNYLFEQIENLRDEDVMEDSEKLKKELQRSKALANLSDQIVKINALQLEAAIAYQDLMPGKNIALPGILAIAEGK